MIVVMILLGNEISRICICAWRPLLPTVLVLVLRLVPCRYDIKLAVIITRNAMEVDSFFDVEKVASEVLERNTNLYIFLFLYLKYCNCKMIPLHLHH